MSGPEPTPEGISGDAEADEKAGVLGNLPRSRPSVRSPRRADPTPDPLRSEAGAHAGPAEPEATGGEAELEALARAGISLAGGAATLGLRVAGRAAAALRDAVERR